MNQLKLKSVIKISKLLLVESLSKIKSPLFCMVYPKLKEKNNVQTNAGKNDINAKYNSRMEGYIIQMPDMKELYVMQNR